MKGSAILFKSFKFVKKTARVGLPRTSKGRESEDLKGFSMGSRGS